MADEAEITFFNNEKFKQTISYEDAQTGQGYDLTGSTFKMDVRPTSDSQSAVAQLTTANGGFISTDLTNGTFEMVIDKGAIAVGKYVYDLVRVNGADETVLLYGTLEVLDGVTQ